MRKGLLRSILFLSCIIAFSSGTDPDNYPVYRISDLGEMAAYGSPHELMNFFEFKKGEVIADIGCGNGMYPAIYSLVCDSVDIYLEDLELVKDRKLHHFLRKVKKIKGSDIHNRYHTVAGTFHSTNLPDGVFDKLILKASFHEFTYMDDMVKDMEKKLKPGGQIYIVEAFSYKNEIIHCDEGHRGYRISEVDSIMIRHGFYLTKMRSPENNWPSYANALVYEKNEARSKAYKESMRYVENLVEEIRTLSQTPIAMDSNQAIVVVNAAVSGLDELKSVYPCMKTWLMDFGWRWKVEKNYAAAINVLKAYLLYFPDSYYALVKLGDAYKADKQDARAKGCYRKAEQIYKEVNRHNYPYIKK